MIRRSKRGRKNQPFWAVVEVASGVPVRVGLFHSWRAAIRRERLWRRKFRPDNDDTGLFLVHAGHETHWQIARS